MFIMKLKKENLNSISTLYCNSLYTLLKCAYDLKIDINDVIKDCGDNALLFWDCLAKIYNDMKGD